MKYILLTKEECPYCIKAKELLEERNLNYKLVNFKDQQEEILQEMKDAYDWETVPMVFSRDGNTIKFIGGYTDLASTLGLSNEQ